MTYPNILIIGGGNMGMAFVKAAASEPSLRRRLLLVERREVFRNTAWKKYGVRTSDIIDVDVARRSSVIFLAVKPQDAVPVLRVLMESKTKATLVSIMAGVSVATLRRATGTHSIIRVMPNLPATVGKGYAAWYATRSVPSSASRVVTSLLQAAGVHVRLKEEEDLDAITAIAGSGPAYVFYFIELLVESACSLGINEKDAREMVLRVLEGSAALLRDSKDAPKVWRERVTSQGGTTEAAMKLLDTVSERKRWKAAIRSAHRRARELSRTLDRGLKGGYGYTNKHQ